MTQHESDILIRAQERLGTVLRGKYRLDRVLGAGGMAVVYKATHRNQAEFAVKMLHPEVSLNADIRSRFLREGYAANSIKHPGAVLVVDDDVAEDGAAFLVMELLDGIACDEAWERSGRRFAPDTALAILIQLLDVLAAAHIAGIVHRDIKPANLFLTRNGIVKVLDFGIARAREAMAGSAGATGTGMMLGTPAFMAPEQANGRSSEIDGRSDLWAAGAAFYSLVSGQLVHQGAESVLELMVKAATQPATSVSTAAPLVTPAVAAIIDRALAFRKEDRWGTAREMQVALVRECPAAAANAQAIVACLVPGSAHPPPLTVGRTIESGPPAQLVVPDRGAPAQTGHVALTTSAATSSDGEIARGVARQRRGLLWALGLVALAAVLGGVGAFKWLRGAPSDETHLTKDAGPAQRFAVSARDGESPRSAARSTPEELSVDAARPACAPESTQCSGSTPQTCAATGEWASGAVTAGRCGAACTPGSSPPQCSGVTPQTCDPAGQWQDGHACNRSQVCRGGTCVRWQPAPTPSLGARPKPSCDPNFTLDENGQKHFKPECFR